MREAIEREQALLPSAILDVAKNVETGPMTQGVLVRAAGMSQKRRLTMAAATSGRPASAHRPEPLSNEEPRPGGPFLKFPIHFAVSPAQWDTPHQR